MSCCAWDPGPEFRNFLKGKPNAVLVLHDRHSFGMHVKHHVVDVAQGFSSSPSGTLSRLNPASLCRRAAAPSAAPALDPRLFGPSPEPNIRFSMPLEAHCASLDLVPSLTGGTESNAHFVTGLPKVCVAQCVAASDTIGIDHSCQSRAVHSRTGRIVARSGAAHTPTTTADCLIVPHMSPPGQQPSRGGSAADVAVPGSEARPFKLTVVGGGPAGSAILVRAARIGRQLLGLLKTATCR